MKAEQKKAKQAEKRKKQQGSACRMIFANPNPCKPSRISSTSIHPTPTQTMQHPMWFWGLYVLLRAGVVPVLQRRVVVWRGRAGREGARVSLCLSVARARRALGLRDRRVTRVCVRVGSSQGAKEGRGGEGEEGGRGGGEEEEGGRGGQAQGAVTCRSVSTTVTNGNCMVLVWPRSGGLAHWPGLTWALSVRSWHTLSACFLAPPCGITHGRSSCQRC